MEPSSGAGGLELALEQGSGSAPCRVLQDALERAARIRTEVAHLKVTTRLLLWMLPSCSCGCRSRPPAHPVQAQALTLRAAGRSSDGTPASASHWQAGSKPAAPRPGSPRFAEPAPSAQPSLVPPAAPPGPTGELQVPPKTVDSEQWTIAAFGGSGSPADSFSVRRQATAERPAAEPAQPASAWGEAPPQPPAADLSPRGKARRSTFAVVAEPSAEGGAALAALAAALHKEQQAARRAAAAGAGASNQQQHPQQLQNLTPRLGPGDSAAAAAAQREWSEEQELQRLLQSLKQVGASGSVSAALLAARSSTLPVGLSSSHCMPCFCWAAGQCSKGGQRCPAEEGGHPSGVGGSDGWRPAPRRAQGERWQICASSHVCSALLTVQAGLLL